jgi:hemerythrin
MLQWIDGYSVNISVIDEQHKMFIDIINEYLIAQTNNEVEEKLSYLLRSLQDYAALHFETEENLFMKFSYPLSLEHTESHNQFRKKIEEFIQKNGIEKEKKQVLASLPVFLKSWLQEHILIHDMKYKKFFNERGIY